ncbi:MAG: hypothetical protein ACTSUC_12080 [Promethearchaeota archaeon]
MGLTVEQLEQYVYEMERRLDKKDGDLGDRISRVRDLSLPTLSTVAKSFKIPERNLRHGLKVRGHTQSKVDGKIVLNNLVFTKIVSELSK